MVALPQVDLVVAATVGGSSIGTILTAIQSGKPIALANKEIIVMAGDLITQAANKYSSTLLPVDSEPSAIWQCLQGENRDIARLLITASGGALRKRPITSLASVTPEEALQHPTWEMGRKITIDSATLMNKAFEVIECHWLFDVPWDRIQIVIHPQSIIHSMVEFSDGSVKAQISPPDMRLPIQYALLYPQRKPNESFKHFDPVSTEALTFEPMDINRYPCFSLALSAAKRGGTYPAVLSAADEVAVNRFLENQYGFLDIYAVVEQVLAKHDSVENPTIEEILAADTWARRQAEQIVVK
jgi:1-deoxy-D-xylulose-5-phosphate reductoisomerase